MVLNQGSHLVTTPTGLPPLSPAGTSFSNATGMAMVEACQPAWHIPFVGLQVPHLALPAPCHA